MISRVARAEWKGSLTGGGGTVHFGSPSETCGLVSRFESGEGTSPEALIAAARASCFSMAPSRVLGEGGHDLTAIRTKAKVALDPAALAITAISLLSERDVPGSDAAACQETAGAAKSTCPVSKARAGVEIVLQEARLEKLA